MNACIILAAKQIAVATGFFTLLWSGSDQHASWEEDWNVGLAGFQLVETRVIGEGLTPPAGAEREGDIWRYYPALAIIEDQLLIEKHPVRGGYWSICSGDACWDISLLDDTPNETAMLKPCP